jgi:hypothetical protein
VKVLSENATIDKAIKVAEDKNLTFSNATLNCSNKNAEAYNWGLNIGFELSLNFARI